MPRIPFGNNSFCLAAHVHSLTNALVILKKVLHLSMFYTETYIHYDKKVCINVLDLDKMSQNSKVIGGRVCVNADH